MRAGPLTDMETLPHLILAIAFSIFSQQPEDLVKV